MVERDLVYIAIGMDDVRWTLQAFGIGKIEVKRAAFRDLELKNINNNNYSGIRGSIKWSIKEAIRSLVALSLRFDVCEY